MGVQSATPVKSAKDRLTLDRRLRLHRQLQPLIDWLDRYPWIFTVVAVTAIIPLLSMGRHSQSLWPFSGVFLYTSFALIIIKTEKKWRANVTKIAVYDDVTGVAPLLDFADVTFLSLYDTSLKPMPVSEAIVLSHIPGLLARMPAGDGPALTASQRSALVRMVCSPIYEKHFRAPGLRAKIDAMTEKR